MVLGAAGGALVGSAFGSGSGRLAAAAIGTLIGGFLGKQLGASLDEADQIALQNESAKALAAAGDGETINWANPDSGASATITPISTRSESRQITLVRDRRVAPPSELDLIGEEYSVLKNARLRSGPTTTSERLGLLAAGSKFDAVGQVPNEPWIVVARDGKIIGYVHDSLVAAAADSTDNPILREPVNLDDIELEDDLVADESTVRTECRTVDVAVKSGDGTSDNQKFDACKGADGAWEIG